jgi:hypothetical protein
MIFSPLIISRIIYLFWNKPYIFNYIGNLFEEFKENFPSLSVTVPAAPPTTLMLFQNYWTSTRNCAWNWIWAKLMLQKNNDKKSKYIFIWFNFIDLDDQSNTINFNINKKKLIIVIFFIPFNFSILFILSIKIKILFKH